MSTVYAISANLKAMFVNFAVERKMQLPFGLILLCDVLLLNSVK